MPSAGELSVKRTFAIFGWLGYIKRKGEQQQKGMAVGRKEKEDRKKMPVFLRFTESVVISLVLLLLLLLLMMMIPCVSFSLCNFSRCAWRSTCIGVGQD